MSIPDSEHFGIWKSSQVKERFQLWNRLAQCKFGHAPYKWLLVCGDIANMYDEIDHDGIMPATRWACDSFPEWIGRRAKSIQGVTVNMVKQEVVAGHGYEEGDVYVSFSDLCDICDYDNRHCWLQWRNKVFARTLGVPMGGILSSHKANLTLGRRESFFMEMLRALGLIGGGIRFMDDVVLAVAVSSSEEEIMAEKWIQLVCGSNGYPAPLQLEVEDRASSYEFLELIVSAKGSELCVEFHSKFETAVGTDAGRFYSRYPDGKDAMSYTDRSTYVTGHLHRIMDGAMCEGSIEESIVLLAKEVVSARWPCSTVTDAIWRVLNASAYVKVWCEQALREVLGKFNWMIGGL